MAQHNDVAETTILPEEAQKILAGLDKLVNQTFNPEGENPNLENDFSTFHENLHDFLSTAQPEHKEELTDLIKEKVIETLLKIADILRTMRHTFAEKLEDLSQGKLTPRQKKDLYTKINAYIAKNTGCKKIESFIRLINSYVASLNWTKETNIAFAHLHHDIAGKEINGLLALPREQTLIERGGIIPSESTVANMAMWSPRTKAGAVTFLKLAGILKIFCQRNQDTRLTPSFEPVDLNTLLSMIGEAEKCMFKEASSRYSLNKFDINVTVEPGTNTNIQADPEYLYLMFMNIIKNTGKILHERQKKGEIPKERGEINIKLFTRNNILFVHYTDDAGGLDITKLFNAGVEQTKAGNQQAATTERIRNVFGTIRQGSFHATRQLTLEDIAMLIFQERLSARQGGSGLGLSEAYSLLAEHSAFVRPALRKLKNGAQFLMGFPLRNMRKVERDTTFQQVADEIDNAENEAIYEKVASAA